MWTVDKNETKIGILTLTRSTISSSERSRGRFFGLNAESEERDLAKIEHFLTREKGALSEASHEFNATWRKIGRGRGG